MLQVSIYRYNPEQDSEPYMQDFQVDTGGKDLMVLDVLEIIKGQDTTVGYRRSCREGVCGSDGLNMNGKNGLACITPLSETVKNNKLVPLLTSALPRWWQVLLHWLLTCCTQHDRVISLANIFAKAFMG